jgi:hypothetical protein
VRKVFWEERTIAIVFRKLSTADAAEIALVTTQNGSPMGFFIEFLPL